MSLQIALAQGVHVHQPVDGLAHIGGGNRLVFAGKGQEGQPLAVVSHGSNAFGFGGSVHHVGGGDLIHQVDFAVLQLLHQRLVEHLLEGDLLDGGLHALIIAAIGFVAGQHRHVIFIRSQGVGAADHGGMAAITGFGIQQGRLQGFRVESAVDVSALAVVQHLAIRSDDVDGIRRYLHQHQLMEIGQIFRLHRQGEGGIVHDAHTGKDLGFPGGVSVLAHDLRIRGDVRAQFRQSGAALQKHREGVIPGGDGGTVGIGQVLIQVEGIHHVAVLIRVGIGAAHGFVDTILAILEHIHGGIAMQQGAHVRVGGVIAPAVGEEHAAHLGQGAHRDFAGGRFFGVAGTDYQSQRQYHAGKPANQLRHP